MEQLKPCPFCGEEPAVDTDGSLVWIYCYHCDARGPRVQRGRWAKKKVAEAWNRRVSDGET